MVQFLVIGAFLSGLWWGFLAPPAEDPNKIEVNQAAIEAFLQFRTRNFSDSAAAQFERMTPPARRAVVDDFIREEALYREAMRLGLGEGDYVIRQRLVQKVDFLGAPSRERSPSRADLEALFNERAEAFRVPAVVTFTHVFLRAQTETGAAQPNAEALALLDVLNRDRVPFHKATAFGNRFPYLLNYVEQPIDVIAGHFGADAAQAIFALQAQSSWQGPVESSWGHHLIYKSAHIEARLPSLDEVEPELRALWLAETEAESRRQATQQILARYEIVISEPMLEALQP